MYISPLKWTIIFYFLTTIIVNLHEHPDCETPTHEPPSSVKVRELYDNHPVPVMGYQNNVNFMLNIFRRGRQKAKKGECIYEIQKL